MPRKKIKIQKNVPIEKFSRFIYPFAELEIGDSFDAGEYERIKSNTIYGSITRFTKYSENAHKKFVCKKTSDNRIKVWRTQ